MRRGQANLFRITNCHLCAGAMLSSRSNFQQLDLCVSSLCREFKKEKKNYPSQILTVILVQEPCSNNQGHTIFVQSRAAVSRRRNSVILAQGPCNRDAVGASLTPPRTFRQTARQYLHCCRPSVHGLCCCWQHGLHFRHLWASPPVDHVSVYLLR